jgi:4-hydroxyacetophenone monooxygenase
MAKPFLPEIALEAGLPDETRDLRKALDEADIVPLLMVLVQFTGDIDLMERCAPTIHGPFDAQQKIPQPLRQEIVDKLICLFDRHPPISERALREPDDALLLRMMSVAVGQSVPAIYTQMMREDLRFDGRDPAGIQWSTRASVEQRKRFRVAIIGAGVSGVLAAIRLRQAGIPFVLFEKNEDVGGTWLENRYPGCGCDTPNHFYSYSFDLHAGWSEYYSKRDELWAYVRRCVDKYGIASDIRFATRVISAHYDEASHVWQVHSQKGNQFGTETFSAVISAVGQLNLPSIPKIPGAGSFAGPSFHTARWPKGLSVAGKRVAIIGTGASAMQVGPAIASQVERLSIFQRSPQWMIPNRNYHRTVTSNVQWLLEKLPFYSRWYRFLLMWGFGDNLHQHLQVDPEWPNPTMSTNAKNHEFRAFALRHIEKEVGDDPDLLKKVIPKYPIFGKRLLMDNHWYKMLRRENVDLIDTPIKEIEADGVVTSDGVRHAADVIVYATGFQAQRMLAGIDIVGLGGEHLRDRWGDDDPRAYLGITVPGFPNLFVLYGPNTNLAHGGSAIFNSECQVRYVMRSIQYLIENGLSAMDVRRDVHDEYNQRVDEATARTVWALPGISNWYKSRSGRITQNSPWTMCEYWHMTKEMNPVDYAFVLADLCQQT